MYAYCDTSATFTLLLPLDFGFMNAVTSAAVYE